MNLKTDWKDSISQQITDLERALVDICLPMLDSVCTWIMGIAHPESRQLLLCPVYVRVRRHPRP